MPMYLDPPHFMDTNVNLFDNQFVGHYGRVVSSQMPDLKTASQGIHLVLRPKLVPLLASHKGLCLALFY